MNKSEEILKASEDVDWNQLMAHNGLPCFHVDKGRFCLRADYWPGHDSMHKFISLNDLLKQMDTK
jgi:hypothetical protein